MSYWIGYGIVLIFGFGCGIGLLILAQRYLKNSPTTKKVVQNITLSFFTLFLVFMVLEIFFKVFFAQSDAWNQTLSSRNWFERYWHLNSMGYRDKEWTETDLQTKKRILVLGDSFAAGQGIENIEDRFSNTLETKLGSEYLVMNIATPGISTPQEIERVSGFPYKPDVLILQYFINDIRSAAHERGLISDVTHLSPPPLINPLVENSYVVNFIYWRTIRLLPRTWQGDDFAWLQQAYNDPDIWWLHQQELLQIYEGAVSEHVKLIVVVFPSMTDIERSSQLTAKVVTFFQERGVAVLDAGPIIEPAPVEQRIVSTLDAHPSVWVHQQVAEHLYEMIQQCTDCFDE